MTADSLSQYLTIHSELLPKLKGFFDHAAGVAREISFDDPHEILDEVVLRHLLKILKPRHCFENAFIVAQALENDFNIHYVEGVVGSNILTLKAYAWNAIEKNGVYRHFDFTALFPNGEGNEKGVALVSVDSSEYLSVMRSTDSMHGNYFGKHYYSRIASIKPLVCPVIGTIFD